VFSAPVCQAGEKTAMTKGEPSPSAKDALAFAICVTCMWGMWILFFLAGAYSRQSPLYWSYTLIVALLTIVAGWWVYVKRRSKPS